MNAKLKVLIVDDSVVVRKLLTDAMASDPEIEVLAAAANGRIALAKMAQTLPDVVTLDVEMPELDGLATLAEIRKLYPKLPVVMFSAFTERAAGTTLEALARGATDYFTKPTGSTALESMERVRKDLVPRLKVLGRANRASSLAPPAMSTRMVARSTRVDIVALGASTGGPNAIAEVLAALPVLPVPMVITQHMPPLFTRLFAERLANATPHRVREAQEGDVLEPGTILVAPGDFHLLLRRDRNRVVAKIVSEPPENSCRPAVDPMVRSVVALYGGNVLNVVLTGMGQDGLRGAEAVRNAGGQIVVQDEATSVVWGMPGFIARAKLADATVPLRQIASQIASRVAAGRTPRVIAEKGEPWDSESSS